MRQVCVPALTLAVMAMTPVYAEEVRDSINPQVDYGGFRRNGI